MTPLRILYLAFAAWGAVHPMYWFVMFMNQSGTGLGGMIDAWYVNASTTGLTWDLTISALALSVAVVALAVSRKMWWALLVIPATFGIGVSCGLPLYLYLRSGKAG
jgi:Terpene cyclase DEP1